ncbi:MAG: hypothetical protein HY265_03945 [Deltaproteobacteria bacterium]|nr:hypothetical protein [Deltaproteobacteria bacterium]
MGDNKAKEIIGRNSNDGNFDGNFEHLKKDTFDIVPKFVHGNKPYPIGRFIVKAHESLWFLGGTWVLKSVNNLSFINGNRNKLIIFFDGAGCAFILVACIARIVESVITLGLPGFIDGFLGR